MKADQLSDAGCVRLFAALATDDEPMTALKCEVCGSMFPLNVPRVSKLFGSDMHTSEDIDKSRLCWVCARLKSSVESESIYA